MFLLIMIIYLVCLQVNSDVIKDIPDTELAQYLTLGDIVAMRQTIGLNKVRIRWPFLRDYPKK